MIVGFGSEISEDLETEVYEILDTLRVGVPTRCAATYRFDGRNFDIVVLLTNPTSSVTLTATLPDGAHVTSTEDVVGSADYVTVNLIVSALPREARITLEPEGDACAVTPAPSELGSQFDVAALPSLQFDRGIYDVPAGEVEITLRNGGGAHTLLFDDPRFTDFRLEVPRGPTVGSMELAPGTYSVFCEIPGHRAAGMEAQIVAR